MLPVNGRARLEARVEELERQAKGKTPQKSSLPPGSVQPHAKPESSKRKSNLLAADRRNRGPADETIVMSDLLTAGCRQTFSRQRSLPVQRRVRQPFGKLRICSRHVFGFVAVGVQVVELHPRAVGS